MHKVYFILHIILGSSAIIGTLWGWQSFGEVRDVLNKEQIKDKTPVVSSPEITGTTRTSERDTKSFPNKKILWEKFLFSPQRSEGVDISEPDTSEKDRNKVDMELVGIGSMGSKSAAIIFVTSQGRSKKENKRHVYVKGSQVEDTGYTVDKIGLQEVTLIRANGEEERVLRIHRQDDASQGRSKTAAKHAAQARQSREKEAEEEKEEKESAPKPPPPPPAPQPGPSGGPSGEDASRSQRSQEQEERLEERKERLKKLREIMKKRRERIKEKREK